jgi:hypothetical protein
VEEIRNVTFGLWGSELPPHAAIQRLAKAGFPIWVPSHLELDHPHSPLQEMFAIIEGESGGYLKAWHANLARDADGAIAYDATGRMTIKSIDLGFIQRNIVLSPQIKMEPVYGPMEAFVTSQFAAYPHLARADLAAASAFDLWQDRGFKPWYAYRPGTDAYRVKKFIAAQALGNWLARSFVGKYDSAGDEAPDFRKLVYLDTFAGHE